ncbi:hypothetical protein NMY22_g12005 [Coprinellus aureogranulatus]|nr:hypothetical protein NMY22_g12005 [Coprinellus aureogranulatus]
MGVSVSLSRTTIMARDPMKLNTRNIPLEAYDSLRKWFTLVCSLAMVVLFVINAPFGRFTPTEHARHPIEWFNSQAFMIDGIKGWIFMELVSPITFFFALKKSPLSFYHVPLPDAFSPQGILVTLFLIHYLNRALLSPLRTPSRSKTHVIVTIAGVAFNLCNGYLMGSFLSSPYARIYLGGKAQVKKEKDAAERKPGDKPAQAGEHYGIPSGLLYEYISYPNYFCEWIEWFGFALAASPLPLPIDEQALRNAPTLFAAAGIIFAALKDTLLPLLNPLTWKDIIQQPSQMFAITLTPPWIFFLNEIFTMLPRAIKGHAWYKERFGDRLMPCDKMFARMSPDSFGKYYEICCRWQLLPNSHLTVTMHQCLQLPEVFRIVCNMLDKTDLFHTALTCRRFTDTALDVLWCELSSLVPLLYTLPEEVLGTNDKDEKTVVAPLKLEHIERLRSVYAPRLRVLRLQRVEGHDVQPSFLEVLNVNMDIGILTPNLVHLDWYSEFLGQAYNDLFCSIPLFLSPGLKHLGIHLLSQYESHRDVFSSISSQYRHSDLKELRLTWGFATTITDGGDSLVPYIRQFDDLHALSIPNLPADALAHVASLPNLQNLRLNDIGPRIIPPPSVLLTYASFRALRILSLVSVEMEHFYGIIQHIPPTTPLQLLSISHAPPHTVQASRKNFKGLLSKWQAVVTLANSHCNPDTLLWIDLEDSSYFGPGELTPLFPIQPDAEDPLETIDITPLFRFKNLKTVELSFAHGLWLTKDVAQGIPQAWKSVEFVDLSTNYPPYRQPRITLEDVVRLVAACPKLWGLGLNFDAMNDMPTPGKLILEKPIRRLVHLKVGNSPIVSTEDVTDFLGLHFPRLHKIETWKVGDYGIAPDYSEKWAKVGEGLQQAIINRRLARKEKAEGKGATK